MALAGLAWAARDLVVAGAGCAVFGVGVYVFTFGPHDYSYGTYGLFPAQETDNEVVAVLGIALVLIGLVFYQREQQAL